MLRCFLMGLSLALNAVLLLFLFRKAGSGSRPRAPRRRRSPARRKRPPRK